MPAGRVPTKVARLNVVALDASLFGPAARRFSAAKVFSMLPVNARSQSATVAPKNGASLFNTLGSLNLDELPRDFTFMMTSANDLVKPIVVQ